MANKYQGVITRFLRDDERLVHSEEKEMPMVIEAQGETSVEFLQQFLKSHSQSIIADMAAYGAVLLRGFAVHTDADFEDTVLSIPEFKGISEAFMSENGRDRVNNLRYVLYTNSVYKTGGTLYLGGFHTENYYSADVPGYISFFCKEPSQLGGETGIINTEKIYRNLSPSLQQKLDQQAYFVCSWLVSTVAERYQVSPETVINLCQYFELPVVGEGKNACIYLYKPSVFIHPLTKEKALQINLFELPALNKELRNCFMDDYAGASWFWHRFFWKMPSKLFNPIEYISVMTIALFNSPSKAMNIVKNKWRLLKATYLNKAQGYSTKKVGSCFSDTEVKELAQSMRSHYSSCIWQKGDILLVDNRKVMHAGMPGVGSRVIRALVCNPVAITYNASAPGLVDSPDRNGETLGAYITGAVLPVE